MSFYMQAEDPPKGGDVWWLLFRQRLVMCVFLKRMFLEASAECAMCTVGDEKCSHLFFECLFAWALWASQKTLSVEVTAVEVFW